MTEQLQKYEVLEYNYEQIRDICGTQDLETIINFIMLRNKRYNYSVNVVSEKENQVNNLRKDIKRLKSDLVKLKNDIIVHEKESNSKTETTIADSGMEKGEMDMIEVEKEKNQELLVLGKKYNEINLAYNQVLDNIKAMKEYDQNHPLVKMPRRGVTAPDDWGVVFQSNKRNRTGKNFYPLYNEEDDDIFEDDSEDHFENVSIIQCFKIAIEHELYFFTLTPLKNLSEEEFNKQLLLPILKEYDGTPPPEICNGLMRFVEEYDYQDKDKYYSKINQNI